MRLASLLLLFALAATVLAGPPGGELVLDVAAVDEAGAPVAGARVEAFAVREGDHLSGEDAATWDEVLDPARRPRTPDASAKSGADGRARLEGFSPMRWTIVASAPGRAAERRTVVLPGFRGPLRLTLRAARPLDGRVVDQLGAPIAGATVVVAWGPTHRGHDAPQVSPLDAWTRADADGRWHFDDVPDEVVRVFASPPGTWSDDAWAILTLDARRFDLEVPLHGPIVGTVRDEETGKPVPGAVVEVDDPVGGSGRVFTRVTADAEGRYVVPRWPDRGIMRVKARAPGLRFAGPENNKEIALSEDGPSTFDVLVREGAMLRGRVLDAGRPVAGVLVWLRNDAWATEFATTDAAGRYAFSAQPGGPSFVGVAAPDAKLSSLRTALEFGMQDVSGEREMTLPERGDVELDLAAPPAPGPRLVGVVVDEDDEPVPYADVASSQGRETQTRGDGFFELPRSGDETSTLTVTDDGIRPLLLSDVRGGVATAERPLVVRVEHERRVRVRGTVNGPDGKPARGGRVVLRLAALGVDWQKDPFRIRPGWRDCTPLGADGSFDVAIGQDRDTIVDLAVVAPGCAPASFDVPDTPPGAAHTHDVRLHAGATIRGRVVSAATKKPVAGARIVLQPDSVRGIVCGGPAPVTYASTGEDGSFVIRELPPGKVVLTAVAPAFGEDECDVVIASGGEGAIAVADFALPPRGQSFRDGEVPPWDGPPHGTLVDEEGATLSGWTVEGYADPDPTHLDRKTLVRATTDAEGNFRFPGTLRVENLLAYPPAAAKGGPRELYPSGVPTYTKSSACKASGGEIVSFEIVDEDGAIATDIVFKMVASSGCEQWSNDCNGDHLCMNELPADARVTLHVEKPGCDPIDVKDVPAGTARMRLVLKRTPPK